MYKTIEEAKAGILETFKEPNYPYICFIAKFYFSKDGTVKEGYEPFILPIVAHHADPLKVDQYAAKGWSVLKWRLPTKEEKEILKDPFRGTTNFGDDRDIYKELEAKLRLASGVTDNRVKELEEQKDLDKKRIAELEAKIKAADKEKSK
jgi:hypothetical protein